ncbi:hypothetical protein [Methylomonas albis]|uniref:Uncharacterized protein n=1 Tax=Methylomonas albis TaxID=1854563 RepID=A0ABR9D2Y7_9GAMM|nr:hypothetical protein [Methylomonas albis]MBD9357484.1 hypothetical protein [Methylomonas albis]
MPNIKALEKFHFIALGKAGKYTAVMVPLPDKDVNPCLAFIDCVNFTFKSLDSIERQTPPELPAKTIQLGKRLYTVKQTVEAYPAIREGGLRYLIFYAEDHKPKGFARSIRRIGREVLIDADSFEACIAQH